MKIFPIFEVYVNNYGILKEKSHLQVKRSDRQLLSFWERDKSHLDKSHLGLLAIRKKTPLKNFQIH